MKTGERDELGKDARPLTRRDVFDKMVKPASASHCRSGSKWKTDEPGGTPLTSLKTAPLLKNKPPSQHIPATDDGPPHTIHGWDRFKDHETVTEEIRLASSPGGPAIRESGANPNCMQIETAAAALQDASWVFLLDQRPGESMREGIAQLEK